MRTLPIALILASLITSLGATRVLARAGDDDGSRGLFIKSRPRKASPVARTDRRARPTTSSPAHVPAEPVGLGFSLYRVLDTARAVRVSPTAIFRRGDKLRFVLEPGIDGYLYVFVTTGTKQPVMIYPDARLERGDNFAY